MKAALLFTLPGPAFAVLHETRGLASFWYAPLALRAGLRREELLIPSIPFRGPERAALPPLLRAKARRMQAGFSQLRAFSLAAGWPWAGPAAGNRLCCRRLSSLRRRRWCRNRPQKTTYRLGVCNSSSSD